jgi:hypothetical protein
MWYVFTGLFLSFSLFACNSINPRQQDLAAMGLPDAPYVQPEFRDYLETFKKEGSARGVILDSSNLTVVFKNLSHSSDLLGECNVDYELVEIDETSWKAMSLYTQEQVLFHELGHCLLKRTAHTADGVLHRGKIIPVSLMAPKRNNLYSQNSRDYYLDELFDKSKAAELSSAYIVAHNFIIEKESYVMSFDTNSINAPILAFLDSNGRMEYLDPSQCTILSVTNFKHQIINNLDDAISVSSGLSLQFKLPGNYIVSFNCQDNTYTQAFMIG